MSSNTFPSQWLLINYVFMKGVDYATSGLKWTVLVSTAHGKCYIAVREHLGDYQLMYVAHPLSS